MSKPPLKKSKDDRPQVVLPGSPEPLQAPSYSAASPPAPPRKPAAAATRIKAANKPGRKEGILDPSSERSLRERAKERRILEEAQKLKEQEKLESEKQLRVQEERVAFLEKSLIKPLFESEAESSASPEKTRDKLLEITSEHLQVETTPSKETVVESDQSEDGSGDRPADLVLDPTDPYFLAETVDPRPASPVADPSATYQPRFPALEQQLIAGRDQPAQDPSARLPDQARARAFRRPRTAPPPDDRQPDAVTLQSYTSPFDKSIQEHCQEDVHDYGIYGTDILFTTLQGAEEEPASQTDLLVHQFEGVPAVQRGHPESDSDKQQLGTTAALAVQRGLRGGDLEGQSDSEPHGTPGDFEPARGTGSASGLAVSAEPHPLPSSIQGVSESLTSADRPIPAADLPPATTSPEQLAPLLDSERGLDRPISLLPSVLAGGQQSGLPVETGTHPIGEKSVVFPTVPSTLETDRDLFDPRVVFDYFSAQFDQERRGSPQAAHSTLGSAATTMAGETSKGDGGDGGGEVPPEKTVTSVEPKTEGDDKGSAAADNKSVGAESELQEFKVQFEKYAKVIGDACAEHYNFETQDVAESIQFPLQRLFSFSNFALISDQEHWEIIKDTKKWPGKGKSPQEKMVYRQWIQERLEEEIQNFIDHRVGQLKTGDDAESLDEQKREILLFAYRKFYRQVQVELHGIIEQSKMMRLVKEAETKLATQKALTAKENTDNSALREQLEALSLEKAADEKPQVKQEPVAYYVARPSDEPDAYIHGQGRAPGMVEGKIPNSDLNWIVAMASTHPYAFEFGLKPGYRFTEHNKTEILNLPAQDHRCTVPLPGYPNSVEVFYDFNITAVRAPVTEPGGRSEQGIYTHIPDKHHPYLRTYYYATQGVTTSRHYLLVVLVDTQATDNTGSPSLARLREIVLRHRSEFMELLTATQEMKNMAKEIWADPRNSPRLSKRDLEKIASRVFRVNDKIGKCLVFSKSFGLHVMPSSRHITTHFAMTHLIQFEQAVQEVINEMGVRGVPPPECEKLYHTTYRTQPITPSTVPKALDGVYDAQKTFTAAEQGATPTYDMSLVVDPRMYSAQGAGLQQRNEFFGDLKLLPRQDLPVFSGKKQDYKRWKSRWMNQVGRDFRLPVSKRMHYLKEAIRKNCQHQYRIAEYELEEDDDGYSDLWARLDEQYEKKGREMVLLWKQELERMQPLTTKAVLYADQVRAAEWFESRLNRILKEYQEARNQAGYDPILMWASLEPKIRHPYKLPWDTYVAIKRGMDPDFLERDQVREFRHWLSKVLLPDLRKKQDLEQIDRAARGYQDGGNGGGGGGGAGHKGGGGGGGGKKGGNGGGGGGNGNGKGGGDGGGNRGGNQITYATNSKPPSNTASPPANGGGELTHQSQVNLTRGQLRNKNKPNRVNSKCILCNGAHSVVDCDASLNPDGLYEKFYSSDTCVICGLVGHYSGICTFKGKRCRKCGKRHVTALHDATYGPYMPWRQKNPELAAKIEENRKKAASAVKPKGAKAKGNKPKAAAQPQAQPPKSKKGAAAKKSKGKKD